MSTIEMTVRLAEARDAAALADLVGFAGEGLAQFLWAEMAGPGEDPIAIGRARQAENARQGKIVVVEEDGQPVAGLHGYPILSAEPVTEGMHPVIRPLQELENLVVGSWYVNVLAAYPKARGRGHGTRLLRLAEARAAEAGIRQMSIIVADTNTGAQRLYHKVGYREVARRVSPPSAWRPEGQGWILMAKDFQRVGR